MKTLSVLLILPGALCAQRTGLAFQSPLTSEAKVLSRRGSAQKIVVGKPVSAVERRRTLQVLPDGTRLETSVTTKFWRDDQGRTRTQRDDGSVSIEDPVSGIFYEVDASTGRTRRVPLLNLIKAREDLADLPEITPAKEPSPLEESLGVQTLSGIPAQGTRTTTTIPYGQIGNDRPISIVSERWYSPDLQLLIRSVNKDPRFGETTFELTGISRTPPDPELFKIPEKSKS